MRNPDLEQRAVEYAKLSGIFLDLESPLGHGTDGSVWTSNRDSAVKALERHPNYRIEVECYQRFQENNVTQLLEFAVPQLIGFDDDRQIVEMTLVSPPFIIDFAKASLDRPIDFSKEQLEDWDEAGREIFEKHWPDVLALLWALKRYGIYYYDAKPGNIMFGE